MAHDCCAAGRFSGPLVFGIGYFLALRYTRFFSESTPAPLWFPDSLLFCAFILNPKKRWLSYTLVGLAIRLGQEGVPTWFSAATYLNDWLKAAFSAYVLQRFVPGSVRLNTLRQFGAYIGIAGVVAPGLSALAGAATRLAMGSAFWNTFYQWFLGDSIAALV